MKWRWRMVVQPKFQTWFLIRFMIYTGSLLLLLGCSIFLWFKIVDDTIFRLVGLISPSSIALIKMNSNMAIKLFIGLTVFLIALAVFESFIFSRKIAGPLFAFLRHLQKCEKKGRLEEFSLRKEDLFIDLTENFNRLVQSVNAKESAKNSEGPKLQPFGNKRTKNAAPLLTEHGPVRRKLSH